MYVCFVIKKKKTEYMLNFQILSYIPNYQIVVGDLSSLSFVSYVTEDPLVVHVKDEYYGAATGYFRGYGYEYCLLKTKDIKKK